MTTKSEEEEYAGPRIAVLVLRARGDLAARSAADEAASLLRGYGREVAVLDALPDAAPDGVLVVATDAADVSALVAAAPRLQQRAVAFALIADEPPEAQALAHRVRKTLRKAGAFVLDRQVVMPREAFGVYGLQSEPLRDRLEALIALFDHDAERLHARREGWMDPEEDDVEPSTRSHAHVHDHAHDHDED